jgi:hypothetical protein
MENTKETNKIIAEFMGYSQPHPDYPNSSYWYKEGKQPMVILLYHSDWNRIMEVVEKIKQIGVEELKFSIEFERAILTLNKKTIYNACIWFIKWYNENKQDNGK